MQTAPQPLFTLHITDPQQRKVLAEMAAAQAEAVAAAEVLNRRYILSPKQTPGLGYDDRLQVRLGCGKTKAYELLQANVIRHQRVGNKYIVSEKAVRAWFGDEELEVSHAKAA